MALGCTVRELSLRMSATEFSEWIAYSRIEPFGERRADQRAWLSVAGMAMSSGGDKIDLAKVLPEWEPPQTPEQVAVAIDRFFRTRLAAERAKEGLN